MYKPWFLIFSSFLLMGCNPLPQEEAPELEKERLGNLVMRKAAYKIRDATSLSPCGTGGCAMREVRMLALSFFYYEMIDIEEARRLLIYAIQTLTKEINAEEKLHKYLYKYPFPPSHTEITIFVQNKDYSPISSEYISIARFVDGILSYDIDHPKTEHLETIYKETYEEALEKLTSSSTPSMRDTS